MKRIRLNPPQIIVLGFIAVIALGSLLLSLPVSTAGHKSPEFIDSLFTATSATCVTGLVIKDTGSYFSPLGKLIILVLIQIGGLGIMTLSTMFAILLGKKLTLSQNAAIQDALNQHTAKGIKALVLYIVAFTLIIESIGALLLYTRWAGSMGTPWLQTLERAAFHSISAFCNAGFSLFSNNLAGFRSDWVVMAVVCMLIVIGGMGFVVFLDILKFRHWNKNRHLVLSQISLQTKIAVLITASLIIGGAISIFLFEMNNALSGLPLKEKIWGAVFTSITPRTAGFNVLPTAYLKPATLLLLIIFMFIGASPGGTGGGIKTVTFGIIMASAYSMFYNRDRITLFKRTIPRQAFRRAAVVASLGLAILVTAVFLLSLTEYATLTGKDYFLSLFFETASAFGTVGLSTGVTPQLTLFGKIIIICTMFAGRVGPLTLALAIAMRKEKLDYHYPEEWLMVG